MFIRWIENLLTIPILSLNNDKKNHINIIVHTIFMDILKLNSKLIM